jgi:hypothetical protein
VSGAVKAYLCGGLAILALVVLAHWRSDVRAAGVVAERQRVADSTAKVADAQAAERAAVARKALQDAESRAQAAEATARRSAALQAATDSAARAAGVERANAERMAADSAATAAQLRTELNRLIVQSRADSAAAERQHAADRLALARKDSALAAYAVAGARSTDAINAAVAAALADHTQTAIAKRAAPSFLARHFSVTAGYGAVERAGVVYAGPGITVGWTVVP